MGVGTRWKSLEWTHRLSFITFLLIHHGCSNDDFAESHREENRVFDSGTSDSYIDSTIDDASETDDLLSLEEDITAGKYGMVDSVLVWAAGEMQWEAYFGEYRAEDLHQIYSVTKSITSAAIGIAIEQGDISGVDTKVLDYFPEYDVIENWDERKAMISLEDLLTMRAGFSWDERSISYNRLDNMINDLTMSPDWIKFVLDLELSTEPGTVFTYNSGITILLSGILQKSTGVTAEQYIAENLFKKIGIADWQ